MGRTSAPIGTPNTIIEKINRDVGLAMQDNEVKNSFLKAGIQPRHMNLDQAKSFVRSEISKYQAIATKAGIDPE
jgi:tripartite-type tricarboxylate transporter receptor subunit TctC